jgi:hypothetical protein
MACCYDWIGDKMPLGDPKCGVQSCWRDACVWCDYCCCIQHALCMCHIAALRQCRRHASWAISGSGNGVLHMQATCACRLGSAAAVRSRASQQLDFDASSRGMHKCTQNIGWPCNTSLAKFALALELLGRETRQGVYGSIAAAHSIRVPTLANGYLF